MAMTDDEDLVARLHRIEADIGHFIRAYDAALARVKMLEDVLRKANEGLHWSKVHLIEADVRSVAVETALDATEAVLGGK
jgi:hypothetical protein